MSSKQWKITNGPTLNGLKTAFCNAFGENDASTRFEIELSNHEKQEFKTEISFKLTKLGYEDGSGHRFVFYGRITTAQSRHFAEKYEGESFDGYYDTKKRIGCINSNL